MKRLYHPAGNYRDDLTFERFDICFAREELTDDNLFPRDYQPMTSYRPYKRLDRRNRLQIGVSIYLIEQRTD